MKSSTFLAMLSPAVRGAVAERTVGEGQILFRRGDRPEHMHFIAEGEARLVRTSPNGSEIIFQRAREGFLAEASLDQPAYHCDGVAFSAIRLLAVPIRSFRLALEAEAFRDFWMRHLTSALRRARAHGERLALRSASERIVHFIESEGRDGALQLSQSKKSWAGELGLTHEALYRALRAMSDAGIIEQDGAMIRIRQAL